MNRCALALLAFFLVFSGSAFAEQVVAYKGEVQALNTHDLFYSVGLKENTPNRIDACGETPAYLIYFSNETGRVYGWNLKEKRWEQALISELYSQLEGNPIDAFAYVASLGIFEITSGNKAWVIKDGKISDTPYNISEIAAAQCAGLAKCPDRADAIAFYKDAEGKDQFVWTVNNGASLDIWFSKGGALHYNSAAFDKLGFFNGNLMRIDAICTLPPGNLLVFGEGGYTGGSAGEIGENTKLLSKYSDKEVFLVSDRDWREVLPLVPVTTWTEKNGEVRKYPTLIWHEEGGDISKLYLSTDHSDSEHYVGFRLGLEGGSGSYGEKQKFSKTYNLQPGEELILYYTLRTYYDTTVTNIEITEKPDFIEFVDPADGKIDNINRQMPDGETFEFRLRVKEDADTGTEAAGFDADSVLYFMQQYGAQKATVVGQTPQELDDLIPAEAQRIYAGDYLSYWEKFDMVVYVADNYELALLASTYASLLNAPMVIEGTAEDSRNVFAGRNVICVGNPSGATCDRQFSLEDLQREYVKITNTDKIMLVNPDDLGDKVEEKFQPEKSASPIYELYGKTSLVAPILASAKHELIITTNNRGYGEVDSDFTGRFLGLFGFDEDSFNTKECKTGDSCSGGWGTYGLEVKESTGDSINYKFDVGDINLADIEYIGLEKLLVKVSCIMEAEPSYIIYVNGQMHAQSDGFGFRWDSLLEGYISPALHSGNLSGTPLESPKLDVTVQIPDCKIIRRLDRGDKILGVTLSDSSKEYSFLEETGVTEKTIGIKGIEAGQEAYFDFSGLDNALDYRILLYFAGSQSPRACGESECKGPYFNGRETAIINGNEISNGQARIIVKANSELEYGILPLASVKLIPLLPKDFYLTIMSSPDAIQMSSEPNGQLRLRGALDFYYSTLNRNYYPEEGRIPELGFLTKLYTGRIFGISPSDTSAYTARDLFFGQIEKDRSGSFILRGDSQEYGAEDTKELMNIDWYWGKDGSDIYSKFPDGVYVCYSYNDEDVGCDTHSEDTKNSYYNSYFTLYKDHGNTEWAFVSSYDLANRYMQPKTNIISACDTCDFAQSEEDNRTGSLFCMQNLRRGALSYIGTQSIALQSSDYIVPMIPLLVLDKMTIGKAFHMYSDTTSWGWPIYYLLIGDPTLTPIYWNGQNDAK
ncbi:MAG: hypothetical protein V1676_02635 [Candidatus Diapherotrites archaeon]